jgi:hypothetical protein
MQNTDVAAHEHVTSDVFKQMPLNEWMTKSEDIEIF